MWFKQHQLVLENQKLANRVAALEKAIDDNNQTCAVNARKDVASSTMAIDFSVMNVFAIERNFEDKFTAVTIVGHIVTSTKKDGDGNVVGIDNKVHEWYMKCSQQEHERLVQEFNEWKARKK